MQKKSLFAKVYLMDSSDYSPCVCPDDDFSFHSGRSGILAYREVDALATALLDGCTLSDSIVACADYVADKVRLFPTFPKGAYQVIITSTFNTKCYTFTFAK